MESARPNATEVRRPLVSWNMDGTAERSDEHLIADADGVDIVRPVQRRLVQHCWSSHKSKNWLVPPWEMMPKQTKLMEPRSPRRCITWAMVQKHGLYPGRHVLPGGHSDACTSRFERNWVDGDSIKATAEAEKDARQAGSSATTTVNPSVAQPATSQSVHQASSYQRLIRRPVRQQTKQQHRCIHRQRRGIRRRAHATRPVGQALMGPGELGSTRKSTTNEPDEDQEGHESKRLGLVGGLHVSVERWTAWTWTSVEMHVTTKHGIIAMAAAAVESKLVVGQGRVRHGER